MEIKKLFLLICLSAFSNIIFCQSAVPDANQDILSIGLLQIKEKKIALNKDRKEFLKHKKNLEVELRNFEIEKNKFEQSKIEFERTLTAYSNSTNSNQEELVKLNNQKAALNKDRKQFLKHKKDLGEQIEQFNAVKKEFELSKASFDQNVNPDKNIPIAYKEDYAQLNAQKVALNKDRKQFLEHKKDLELKLENLKAREDEFKDEKEKFDQTKSIVKEVPAQIYEESEASKLNVRSSPQVGKIQIAALASSSRSFEQLSHLGLLTIEKINTRNLYRYKIIPYGNTNLKDVLSEIKTSGFPDAFLTK